MADWKSNIKKAEDWADDLWSAMVADQKAHCSMRNSHDCKEPSHPDCNGYCKIHWERFSKGKSNVS